MDWDKLRIFHAVAEAGSFTRAGEALNLSQSAVSRQIGALEESLRVLLFHRHARGLILTEQGELLYRTAHEVFAKVAMTEAQLAESKERPKGSLTVTSTVGFSTVWLTPRIAEFLDLYPEISVTLLAEDRELDLAMREVRGSWTVSMSLSTTCAGVGLSGLPMPKSMMSSPAARAAAFMALTSAKT